MVTFGTTRGRNQAPPLGIHLLRASLGIRAPGRGSLLYRPNLGTTVPANPNHQEGRMAEANFDKFRGIIAEQLGVDVEKVTPEASFTDDLQADSLDLVELIMAFEEEYGMEISDDDAQKLRTVGEAWNYVKGKVSVA